MALGVPPVITAFPAGRHSFAVMGIFGAEGDGTLPMRVLLPGLDVAASVRGLSSRTRANGHRNRGRSAPVPALALALDSSHVP